MSNKNVVTKAADKQLPALAGMYEEDAGGGFETADSTAYAIPFLAILQALSPQLNKQDGLYIKGAEQGMLLNSATAQTFDGEAGVIVVPCYYKQSFTHWQPRDTGGGFLGEVQASDPILLQTKDEKGELTLPDGTYFTDTRTHYVLIVDEDGGFTPAVVSMSSTQIKKSRQWMTRMQNIKLKRKDGSLFTAPMFSNMYRLTTVPESNAQGSWYGWKVETLQPVDDANLYQAAKAFRDSVKAGEVKEQVPASAGAEKDVPEEF